MISLFHLSSSPELIKEKKILFIPGINANSLPSRLLFDIHLLCNLVGFRDMSSDTAKENASVVDSSVTEWKHDMGNSDDPGIK